MAAAAIPLITAGISALSGLFGNKNKQTTTQNQSSSGSTSATSNLTNTGRSTTTSGPQLTPAYQNFINQLVGSFSNLSQPVNLQGYAASQVQGINRASTASQKAADNIMASRGLSRSPVSGTTAANIDANRISQIVGLNQQIPLLENQLNLQNLNAAQGLASILPSLSPTTSVQDTSGTQSGTSTGFTSNQSQGTGVQTQESGGGLSGLLNALALMMQTNSGNNSQQPYGGGSLGWLANLFG